MTERQTSEQRFFRGLNELVEPMVRAGFLSPGPWPTGAVVVETRGRKSGRKLNVPLLGALFGDLMVVSTVRSRRSQWVRNLAANPDVRYWIRGRPREARAFVFLPGTQPPSSQGMPLRARLLAMNLLAPGWQSGLAFAILVPRRRAAGRTLTPPSGRLAPGAPTSSARAPGL